MQKVMATTGGMGMGPGGPGMINIPPSILNNPNIPNEIIHALQAGRLGSTVFVANVSKWEQSLKQKNREGWKHYGKQCACRGKNEIKTEKQTDLVTFKQVI